MHGGNSALLATQKMLPTSLTCFLDKVSDLFCCQLLLISSFFIATGQWPKTEISNKDVIRLQLACDVMKIDARQSIYYTALKAFGNEGVNTHMYATVFHFIDFRCAYSLH